MTRINLIPVDQLMDQHLLAEHREIKRIPNVLLKGDVDFRGIPPQYVLGTGHVKFFYNKLMWLYCRYMELYVECYKRGFDVTYYGRPFIELRILAPYLWNYWSPSNDEILLSEQRIREKIEAKPGFYRKSQYKPI